MLVEARPQDIGEGLNDNLARHLGFSNSPIYKDNGYLYDLETLPRNSICEFHLECVAVRLDGVQIDALQDLAAIAAKSGSAVMYWNAEHKACKDVTAVSVGSEVST